MIVIVISVFMLVKNLWFNVTYLYTKSQFNCICHTFVHLISFESFEPVLHLTNIFSYSEVTFILCPEIAFLFEGNRSIEK